MMNSMDRNQRQGILNEKLKMTKQKIYRQTYLDRLPVEYASIIGNSEAIYTPQREEILSNGFVWKANEVTNKQIKKLNEYSLTTVSWAHKATDLINRISYEHKNTSPAYLFSYKEDSPLFCLDFGWVKENFGELWKFSNESLGIVSTDFSLGVHVIRYFGFHLEEDPNPNEVVYDIITWGLPTRM